MNNAVLLYACSLTELYDFVRDLIRINVKRLLKKKKEPKR